MTAPTRRTPPRGPTARTATLRPVVSAILLAALVLAPASAHAQGGLIKRIRTGAKQRAAAAADRAVEGVTSHTNQVADSTLQLGVAGVDSLSGRATGGLLGAVGGVRRRIPAGVGGVLAGATGLPGPATAAAVVQAASQVQAQRKQAAAPVESAGEVDADEMLRIPLMGVAFAAHADTLDAAAVAYLREFARGLPALGTGWTVQAILPPSSDPARDRARAERRAAVVRAALVRAGADPGRIAARGRVADAQTAPEIAVASVFLVRQP